MEVACNTLVGLTDPKGLLAAGGYKCWSGGAADFATSDQLPKTTVLPLLSGRLTLLGLK